MLFGMHGVAFVYLGGADFSQKTCSWFAAPPTFEPDWKSVDVGMSPSHNPWRQKMWRRKKKCSLMETLAQSSVLVWMNTKPFSFSSATMGKLIDAIVLLHQCFCEYAGTDGDKNTMSKKEVATMFRTELGVSKCCQLFLMLILFSVWLLKLFFVFH